MSGPRTAGGSLPDTVSGMLPLADGGIWTAGTLQVGLETFVGDSGTLASVAGTVEVAASGSFAPTTLETAGIVLGTHFNIDAGLAPADGTLDVTGGSEVITAALSIVAASEVMIDGASSLVLGGGTAQRGMLVVASGGTLAANAGTIVGGVALGGMLAVSYFGGVLVDEQGADNRFWIDGSLTGDGTVTTGIGQFVGPPLEIGSASGFTGTFDLTTGQILVLDTGGAPHARLTVAQEATIDLRGIGFTGQAPTYSAALGSLTIGAATLDVGTGLAAADFSTVADTSGGTFVVIDLRPTWQAAGGNPGGDWGDANHWNTGSVPGGADTVAIGPGVSADSPWTVTAFDRLATDLTLGMGLGTFAVSGGLSLESTLSLDSGTLLATSSAIAGSPTYDQSGGLLDVAGGQFFATYATLNGTAAGTIQGGGQWTASELALGGNSLDAASVSLDVTSGTLTVQDQLALGAFVVGQSPISHGTLALAGGAMASARLVTMTPGSLLSVDTTSAMTIGQGAAVAGAIAVTARGTLQVTGAATLGGNLVADGSVTLEATSVPGVGFNTGPTVLGNLSGNGDVLVASDAEMAAASGFTGTLALAGGLTLDSGAAPGGLVLFEPAGPMSAALDLRGVAWSGASPLYDATTGVLSVGAMTLDVGTSLPQGVLSATEDGFGGTEIAVLVPCFAAGTRIATPDGEVEVERLSVGDLVLGPWGEAMAVRWLGHRRVDCARHPRPEDVWPVRVRAGAFRPGVPARDLRLSPDHGLFIAPPGVRPVLVPVRCLIDGASVAREAVAGITYWHVELERHAVLLAERLPCESFLDTGNRAAFANGGTAAQLHPDFAAAVWEARACAPQVRGGPVVAWARGWLAARRANARPTEIRRRARRP